MLRRECMSGFQQVACYLCAGTKCTLFFFRDDVRAATCLASAADDDEEMRQQPSWCRAIVQSKCSCGLASCGLASDGRRLHNLHLNLQNYAKIVTRELLSQQGVSLVVLQDCQGSSEVAACPSCVSTEVTQACSF